MRTQRLFLPGGWFLRFLMVFLGAWLAVGSTALAQTTGQVRGSVFDEDGLEIPGVTVTLTGDSLIGGAQERATDGAGAYRFSSLLPGVYDLTAVKGGFRPVTVKGVQISINRTTTQNLVMKLGEAEEVIVTDRQTVDVTSTTNSQVLTKDFLQRIPTGRSYQQAVNLASGVQPGSGSNPNIGGAASNENTYMLDGATITDPVTGTFSLNFNYDAIQQIEVLLGGYEAEYGISLGGIVNLVTESGTNNLTFDTSVFYTNGNWRPRTDERFTSDGFRLGPTGFDSTLSLLTLAAKVTGPLVRDRAWFVFSYQHSRSLIAQSGIPQRRDFDGHYLLSKLTLQPNAEHRVSLLFQTDPTTIDNISQGNPFQKAEAQGRQAQSGFVGQVRWQWFLTPDINLDTRVSVQKISIEQYSVPCTHNRQRDIHPCRPGEAEGEIDFFTPGRIGLNGAFDSVAWGSVTLDDRWRYNASTKLSLLAIEDSLGGTHDLKLGLEGSQFINNSTVSYAGNSLRYDYNLVGFDPDTFASVWWAEASGPLNQRNVGSTWNFFLQDAYKPVSNLTIKYGMRFDNTILRNDVGEPVIVGNLWGPRFHAAWDPWGDQKTKIAGGYGRFNDSGRQSISDFTSVSSFGVKFFRAELWDDGNGQGYLNSQSLLEDFSPRENPNVAHENLRLPSSDEFIILLQRQIVKDVSIGSNMTAKFTRHLYEHDQINLIYDEDGSAIIGSRRDDAFTSVSRLRTPLEARRNYYQVDVYLDKVVSKRWGGRMTYTYTYSNGSSASSLSGSFANDAQTRYNYGPFLLSNHVIKGYAFWDLPTDPWKQTVSFFLTYASGEPLERRYWSDLGNGGNNLRIRPRGIYTTYNDWWELSLKFQQFFDVRKGQLIVDIELQNAFNNQAPFGLSRSSLNSQNRLFTTSRQDPLRVQLGLRYQF